MIENACDPSEVVVRRAAPGDGAGMVFYTQGVVAEDLDTVPSRTVGTPEEHDARLADLEEGSGVTLVADYQGQIVGLLDLRINERRGRTHVGSLGMTVARSWRGKGLGRRLLETATQQARSWPNVCRLEIEVVPWNQPAIALYQKAGFQLEARKSKAINLRGGPEDVLLMALVW